MFTADYLAISRIVSKFLNLDNNTTYQQCKNQILINSLQGKTKTSCPGGLTEEEVKTLEKEEFKVFPVYVPWVYEDPLNHLKLNYLVRWSE